MSHVIEQVDKGQGIFVVDGSMVMLGSDARGGDDTDPFERALRQLHPSDAMSPPIDRILPRRLGNPEHVSVALLPHLQQQAEAAREQLAVSYRGFLVGAAALAFSSDGESHIFVGGNIKPDPSAAKRCAELVIKVKLDTANEHRSLLQPPAGVLRVAALAVHGPADFSSVYDTPTLTLHPCSDCQTMMEDSAVFTDDTLIVTTANRNGRRDVELQTAADIMSIHRG